MLKCGAEASLLCVYSPSNEDIHFGLGVVLLVPPLFPRFPYLAYQPRYQPTLYYAYNFRAAIPLFIFLVFLFNFWKIGITLVML